jgi:hypothetical protein
MIGAQSARAKRIAAEMNIDSMDMKIRAGPFATADESLQPLVCHSRLIRRPLRRFRKGRHKPARHDEGIGWLWVSAAVVPVLSATAALLA